MDEEEKRLLALARRGDASAFGRLVERLSPRVFRAAFLVLRNEDDALDASQETFLRAWKALARFDGNASLATWLTRIATNVAIDICRSRARKPEATLEVDPEAPGTGTPASTIRSKEIGERIEQAFAELSPEHRAAISLKEIEGLSYAEIAQIMRVSVGTVMSRLFYARKKLQNLLGDLRDEA